VSEFVSQVEALAPEVRELRFLDTAGLRPFGRYFCTESIMHPARANLFLLYYLIRRYTKEGETVLDCMAGTYSTCIIASLLGRPSIGAEYEQKFYEWGLKNRELLEKSGDGKAPIVVIKGDSRFLSEILQAKCDIALFSPPYASEQCISTERDQTEYFRMVGGIGHTKHIRKYLYQKDENIANLPYGAKGGTYLQAMQKIYQECFKVLRLGGLMVLIVRPFIRSRQVVDLPYHTWLLCKQAGFKLKEVLKLRRTVQSFWRLIYHRKHPEVPQIRHEYVLVLQK